MLEIVLDYLNNDFCVAVKEGVLSVKDGTLVVSEALNGQYVRLIGSILNDGVYKVEDGKVTGLADEDFIGKIRYLAIPKALLELIPSIEEFEAKSTSSPYKSESFADYKYDKGGLAEKTSWEKAFSVSLRQWRKL